MLALDWQTAIDRRCIYRIENWEGAARPIRTNLAPRGLSVAKFFKCERPRRALPSYASALLFTSTPPRWPDHARPRGPTAQESPSAPSTARAADAPPARAHPGQAGRRHGPMQVIPFNCYNRAMRDPAAPATQQRHLLAAPAAHPARRRHASCRSTTCIACTPARASPRTSRAMRRRLAGRCGAHSPRAARALTLGGGRRGAFGWPSNNRWGCAEAVPAWH